MVFFKTPFRRKARCGLIAMTMLLSNIALWRHFGRSLTASLQENDNLKKNQYRQARERGPLATEPIPRAREPSWQWGAHASKNPKLSSEITRRSRKRTKSSSKRTKSWITRCSQKRTKSSRKRTMSWRKRTESSRKTTGPWWKIFQHEKTKPWPLKKKWRLWKNLTWCIQRSRRNAQGWRGRFRPCKSKTWLYDCCATVCGWLLPSCFSCQIGRQISFFFGFYWHTVKRQTERYSVYRIIPRCSMKGFNGHLQEQWSALVRLLPGCHCFWRNHGEEFNVALEGPVC